VARGRAVSIDDNVGEHRWVGALQAEGEASESVSPFLGRTEELMPLRIVINEDNFRALVIGRVASYWTGGQQVELILSDITHRRMIDAVIDALTAPHRGPPDPPEAAEFLPRRPKRPGKGK
jgi:hypothetical protein